MTATSKRDEVVLPLAPVPAARPRVGRWGTYYPKTYAKWRETVKRLVEGMSFRTPPTTRALFVSVFMVCARPKTTKRLWPRGDVDNFVKAACDALNKAAYGDDDQIVRLYAEKRYVRPDEAPHTRVTTKEIEPCS